MERWTGTFQRLSSEFLILHLIGGQQSAKRITKQERIVPLIEAPFKFLKVTIEMFSAHLVVGTDDRPLKQAPDAFDAIGMNVAPHPFLRTVIDALVLCVGVSASVVAGIVVSVDPACVGMSRFSHETMKHLGVSPLLAPFDPKIDLAAAFQGTENHRLIADVSRPNVTALSADISFVHFDRSANAADLQGSDLCHRLADAMAEIPSRFVANGDRSPKLAGRDSLLAFAHQIHGKKPLPQSKVRIIKNRTSRHGELVAA